MSPLNDKSFNMRMRNVETALRHRRIPYPKRSVELIALVAISCTFFLFIHTNKLNSRLKEMEVKLQPSELSSLGLLADHHIADSDIAKNDFSSLHGTYQYLKSTGQQHPKIEGYESVLNSKRLRNPDNYHPELNYHIPEKVDLVEDITHDLQKYHKEDYSSEADDAEDGDEDDDDGNEDVGEDDNDDGNELMAHLLNNTKKAEVDIVFFNRVPKVGSQSLMELMIRLGKINGFEHSRDMAKRHETIMLNPPALKELIADILSKSKPTIYSQHIAYINFTRFHMPRPIYINLIRDPIERIISWHYYIRAPWYYKQMQMKLKEKAPPTPTKEFMDMDLDTCVRINDIHCQFNQMQVVNPAGDHRRQTLFFCGQNKQLCMPFNSESAMQQAKRTVEEEYAVVGTWEDTDVTLTVLEHYIPRFFRNAKSLYYLGSNRLSRINKNPLRREISDETREILGRNLTREIEFYEFCKQRLYLQYAALRNRKMNDNNDYLP